MCSTLTQEVFWCEPRAWISQEREEGSAGHQLHDYHDRLLLDADPDELDNVGVVVLLEDPALLKELFLLFLGQRHFASFDSHTQSFVGFVLEFKFGFIDIAKIASASLKKKK